jgi:hypothetical protein
MKIIVTGALLVLSTVSAASCSLAGPRHTYGSVNFDDGIVSWEARLIAREYLLNKGLAGDYHFDQPDLFLDPQYPDVWFARFYPLYVGMRMTDYLVVIDQATGRVRFANYWWPSTRVLDDILTGAGEEQ